MNKLCASQLVIKKPWTARKEGFEHQKLKDLAIFWLKEIGAFRVLTEVKIGLGYTADVVGYFQNEKTVAFECGDTKAKRMRAFKDVFTVAVHIPYCFSPDIMFEKSFILDKIEARLILED